PMPITSPRGRDRRSAPFSRRHVHPPRPAPAAGFFLFGKDPGIMFKDVSDTDGAAAPPPHPERHGAARDPSRPPPGAAADWTVPQDWEAFTADEHAVWDLLFARQQEALAGRAVSAFAEGLDVLRLSRPGIPEFGELNAR